MIGIEPGSAPLRAPLSALLDAAFGVDRHLKTAYRLRDGVAEIEDLWFVALSRGVLKASIQYWPVTVAGEDCAVVPALLLGPIAVCEDLRGKGIGQALIETSLAVAALNGHHQVILVGDAPYYTRVGFSTRNTQGLSLPGPFDPARLLSRQIREGAALPQSGQILPAFTVPTKREQAESCDYSQPSGQQWGFTYAERAPGLIAL